MRLKHLHFNLITIVFIIVALSLWRHIKADDNSFAADNSSKYESLIKRYADSDGETIINAATKYDSSGHKGEAMVLYMLEHNRRHENLSPKELDFHILAFLKAGDIYYNDGNYPEALSMYVKGLKISEQFESQPYSQILYKNIGNIYSISADYPKSIVLYEQGLECPGNDSDIRYKILQNIIGACIYLDSIPKAKKYYEESLNTPHKITDETEFMDGFIKTLIAAGEGKQAAAIAGFSILAQKASEEKINPRYEASCYDEISKCHMALGDYAKAAEYLEKCRAIAEANSQMHMFAECLKTLSEIYEILGNNPRSLSMKSRYLEIKDSIFNAREFDKVKNQQFVYEMDKSKAKISRLHFEMEKRDQKIKWQQTIISVIVVALAIILILLYIVCRQKKRLHQSYTSLYNINKEASADSLRAEKREKELRAAIKAKDEEIDMLRVCSSSENSAILPPVHMQEEEEQNSGDSHKYSSSNLNEDKRESLADAIQDVMENTLDFCDPDFSLDSLSAKVGSNAKYVSQVINEVFGKNFNNYVNTYRIRLACKRLADIENYGSYTIKAIGNGVGYKSPTSFINVFRKINGITPSIYQKMAKEDSSRK